MKPTIKRISISLGVVLLIAVSYLIYRGVCIGAAYKAKILCSGVFLAKRAPEAVLSRDLAADDLAILKHFDAHIDYERHAVTSDFFGLAERTALYRPGLGCTLVNEGQVITIIPSRDLVIVRLGLSRLPHAWDHASFIARLLEAFPGR